MRTTDFCFSLPDYEYPCFVSYRHLFEAYASPLANGLASTTRRPVNLAFHDAESASAGFFRVGARHDSSGAPVGAVPLTPLSLPILRLGAFAWSHSSWLPRPLPSPLREEETISTARGDFHRRESEGCPSGVACIATGDTPRACVERYRSRSRSRDAFAMIRPLASFHPRLLKHSLARMLWVTAG